MTALARAVVVVMLTAGASSGEASRPQTAVVGVVVLPAIGLGLLLVVRRRQLLVGPLLMALGVVPLLGFAADAWAATSASASPWPGAHGVGITAAGA